MTDTRYFPMQRLEHEERMKRRTLEVCVCLRGAISESP